MKIAEPTSSPHSVELNARLIDEGFRRATSSARKKRNETPVDAQDQAAVAEWESEGGRIIAMPREPSSDRDSRWPVQLPPGYTSQSAWGFRDKTGRYWYEFHRVYGPPERRDHRGPICLQDENRSYWCVNWTVTNEAGHSHLTGRSMTYAEARGLLGARLTFDRFFSLRAELPELLGV